MGRRWFRIAANAGRWNGRTGWSWRGILPAEVNGGSTPSPQPQHDPYHRAAIDTPWLSEGFGNPGVGTGSGFRP